MARKPRTRVGTRTRFLVFERDNFQCRYCGRRPPDVTLQIDHLTPVAAGGDNKPANLLTSCRTCNAGKSDKMLEETGLPPVDAETIARLEASVAAQRKMLALQNEMDGMWQEQRWKVIEVWGDLFWAKRSVAKDGSVSFTDCAVNFPSDGTIRSWLAELGHSVLVRAIEAAATKFHNGGLKGWGVEAYVWGAGRGIQKRVRQQIEDAESEALYEEDPL